MQYMFKFSSFWKLKNLNFSANFVCIQLGFSGETGQQGVYGGVCARVYLQKERVRKTETKMQIYFKELAHRIVEAW